MSEFPPRPTPQIPGGISGADEGSAASRSLAVTSVPSSTGFMSDKDFYQQHCWSMNPLLSLAECMERMGGELKLLEQPLSEWQQAEVRLNVFLLAAAVDQITCDYLARGYYEFVKLSERFPQLRWPVWCLHALNRAGVVSRELLFDRSVADWQVRWRELLKESASLLLEGRGTPVALQSVAEHVALLGRQPLPAELKASRLKLPSAFRSMDLTHHDYHALADGFAQLFPDRNEPLLVLGLRSTGNYLAPLVETRLVALGFTDVTGLTIRPKAHALTMREVLALRRAARERCRILVVDDLPTTGKTLRVTCDLLVRHGVSRDRIVLLIPQQPEHGLREKLEQKNYPPQVARVELKVEEWRKVRWLDSEPARRTVERFAAACGYDGQLANPIKDVEAYDPKLDFRTRYGLHLKKLFDLETTESTRTSSRHLILAKSIGWGWFAYHAWLVAEKLEGRIPCLLGMCEGILFTEWISGPSVTASSMVRGEALASSLANYVAQRVREFPLPGRLATELSDRENTSWDYLAGSLGRAYGRAVAKLIRPAMRRRLISQLGKGPCTLIDAKVLLDKWAMRDGHLVKLDFEGHGIDNADLFMVDPAFDLAGAIFEFCLSPEEEEILLARYAEAAGDTSVGERMPSFKQLYALRQLYKMGEQLADSPRGFDRAAGHARFEKAKRFLVNSLLRHYGQFLPVPKKLADGPALFVLDVDGVLDEYIYEYPATTLSGLEALALLHRHNIPVALNTERSLEDVQSYSKFYHLRGGAAEHGTVLWDAWRGREEILMDVEAREQLECMRAVLSADSSVFFSTGYRTSLHCYTYGGDIARRGLDADRVRALMEREGLNRLRAVFRPTETTVVARSLDKGNGLEALKEFLGIPHAVVHAIGNASEDLPMLTRAAYSYAVANSTEFLRASLPGTGCKILTYSSQRGLLEAARLAVAYTTGRAPGKGVLIPRSAVERDPLLRSARIADSPKLKRLVDLLLAIGSVAYERECSRR